ncbi:hypothetical protein PoB_007372200 [Plakobranchus ocellatus]|uniref:Uncharacterized protein n=1 Tax=Plakobranchus ocellatus TaxID=259542 RepID=A0AAV4DSC2_9GAST|nr:hypothetical protein PoB_007372200 [Plakobranchus ocellatus]
MASSFTVSEAYLRVIDLINGFTTVLLQGLSTVSALESVFTSSFKHIRQCSFVYRLNQRLYDYVPTESQYRLSLLARLCRAGGEIRISLDWPGLRLVSCD